MASFETLHGVGTLFIKKTVGTTVTNIPIGTLKEVGLAIEAEDIKQTAGDRLFPINQVIVGKSGRVRLVDAVLNMNIFPLLGCAAAATSADLLVDELLTVSSGEVTLSEDSVVDTIAVVDSGESLITGWTRDDATTISGLDAYDDTQVKVYYKTTVSSDCTKYSLKYDDIPLYLEITHSSLFRNADTNALWRFQTMVYRFRLVGNYELNYVDRDWAPITLEGEILDPGRADKKILDYVRAAEPTTLSH